MHNLSEQNISGYVKNLQTPSRPFVQDWSSECVLVKSVTVLGLICTVTLNTTHWVFYWLKSHYTRKTFISQTDLLVITVLYLPKKKKHVTVSPEERDHQKTMWKQLGQWSDWHHHKVHARLWRWQMCSIDVISAVATWIHGMENHNQKQSKLQTRKEVVTVQTFITVFVFLIQAPRPQVQILQGQPYHVYDQLTRLSVCFLRANAICQWCHICLTNHESETEQGPEHPCRINARNMQHKYNKDPSRLQ